MKEEGDLTTIQVKKSTRDRFRDLGKMTETMDDLLLRLIDVYEKMHVEYEKKYGVKK